MCILSSPDVAATIEPTPARLLTPQARQQLARDALDGQPISQLANQHQLSRKFVYQQLHHAHDALEPDLSQMNVPRDLVATPENRVVA